MVHSVQCDCRHVAYPNDFCEAATNFRMRGWQWWRQVMLPGIFPYFVTGAITAAGGAWNASIVAEYFRFQGRTLTTGGLGAIISQATDQGDFPVLLGATVLMSAIVVTVNRLVWRPLYALAETRFALEN